MMVLQVLDLLQVSSYKWVFSQHYHTLPALGVQFLFFESILSRFCIWSNIAQKQLIDLLIDSYVSQKGKNDDFSLGIIWIY